MPMTDKGTTKPRPIARRGGRPAKPISSNKDKALVCHYVVADERGQHICGQVLSNRKQANTHLARQHGLIGAEKAEALSGMGKPCPFEIDADGLKLPERTHQWKLMPDGGIFWSWCMACGATEQLTQMEQKPLHKKMDDEWFRTEFGPCAMGDCQCEVRLIRDEEVGQPSDADLMAALALASNPASVDDHELERWTAHRLLINEAQRRGLAIPPGQDLVLSYEDENENPAIQKVPEDLLDRQSIRYLLQAINIFRMFSSVQDSGMSEPTIAQLAHRLACEQRWPLPQCERSVWVPAFDVFFDEPLEVPDSDD